MRKKVIFQLGIVIAVTLSVSMAVVVVGGYLVYSWNHLPEGWKNIAEVGDVHGMALAGNILYTGGKDGVFRIDVRNGRVLGRLKLSSDPRYVKSLCFDSADRLWIAHNEGIECVTLKKHIHYGLSEGLPSSRVYSIIELKSGMIMAGTDSGAICFRKGRWELWHGNSKLLSPMVNVIKEDSSGGLWFGSYSAPAGGISCYTNNGWQYFSTDDKGLPHNNITSIYELKNGEVWAGCGLYLSGGAVCFAKVDGVWTKRHTLHKCDGLIGEKVRSVYEDKSGRIWFGSEYDGISIYTKKKRFKYITVKNGLINPEVKCMVIDNGGNAWIGSRRGVTFITMEALQKCLNRK